MKNDRNESQIATSLEYVASAVRVVQRHELVRPQVQALKQLLDLVSGRIPTEDLAAIDPRAALTRRYLLTIGRRAHGYSISEVRISADEVPSSPRTGRDALGDRLVLLFIRLAGEERGRAIGAAVARLLEDAPRISDRRYASLGAGFENRLDMRWALRADLMSSNLVLLEAFERHRLWAMQDPVGARRQIEADLGVSIPSVWFQAERFAATLGFVRSQDKTVDGDIRWLVDRDPDHGFILRHLGWTGYWMLGSITDAHLIPSPLRSQSDEDFHSVYAEDKLRAYVPIDLSARGRVTEPATLHLGPQIRLVSVLEGRRRLVGHIASDADASDLLKFVQQVVRVANGCAVRICPSGESSEHPLADVLKKAVALGRRHAARTVRLVYVLADSSHPLEGVPDVGASFVRDALEKAEMDAEVVHLPPAEFDDRISELLGADIVGIGVYIHNRDHVAYLTRRLRTLGYDGLILLGGPEARDIERVMWHVPGWNAIIAGDAEHVVVKVIEALDLLDQGLTAEALQAANRLRGVVLRRRDGLVLLCDAASRNHTNKIECPLPYNCAAPAARLMMNFTRGCPYECSFCPNHQGRRHVAGSPDTLWLFTVRALADSMELPDDVDADVRQRAAELLGLDARTPLPVLLELCWRRSLGAMELAYLYEPLREATHPAIRESPALIHDSLDTDLDLREAWMPEEPIVSTWLARKLWLDAKAGVFASMLYRARSIGQPPAAPNEPFVIQTSEDNTLANKRKILEYLARGTQLGLRGPFFRFDPGQNTVKDLLDTSGKPDMGLIQALAQAGEFRIALGVDGTSNAILRQNLKPGYKVCHVLAVNKVLREYGATVENNYILLTPESSLLDAVESFLLFILTPVPWRYYGEDAINLRVIAEETTRATDESILHDPKRTGWDVPLRDPELATFVERFGFSSRMSQAAFIECVWRAISEQPAAGLLEMVVQRWSRNLDDDPELTALGSLLVEARQTLQNHWETAFRAVAKYVKAHAIDERGTIATFADLMALPASHRADAIRKL
ncbi:MAG TPA: hypothetical protein VI670_22190 [Thermoanaerobaculia bacterium]|jgi:hypothetical protein